jgi:hypothetical protein
VLRAVNPRSGGVIFDRPFDKWSFAQEIAANAREFAHDGEVFAAAGGVACNGRLARERVIGAGAKPQAVAAGTDHPPRPMPASS